MNFYQPDPEDARTNCVVGPMVLSLTAEGLCGIYLVMLVEWPSAATCSVESELISGPLDIRWGR